MARRDGVRRDRPRRDAARAPTASRSAGGCARSGVWSPVLMLTARDARRGPGRRARRGRRRLPDQAVLLRRAARAAARAGAPAAPVERPAVLEVGDLRLDPATRRVWRGDAEIALSAKEFALLETFMRRPGRGALAATSCSSTPGTTATRTARTSSTSTSATCARRSTARSAASRSRPCAASATGCAGRP